MNKRYLIYGVVVLVLAMVLGGEETINPYKLKISLKDTGSLKTICLEEIVGFDSGTLGKIAFCDCVSKTYAINVSSAEKFKASYEETAKAHWLGLRETYTKARNVANTGSAPVEFDSGDPALNVLLERFKLSHPIEKLETNWEQLSKASGKFWKRSMYTCSQPKL